MVEVDASLEEVGIGETAIVALMGKEILRLSISMEGHFLMLEKCRLVSWSHLQQARLVSRPNLYKK
jgi:hypothetical protein